MQGKVSPEGISPSGKVTAGMKCWLPHGVLGPWGSDSSSELPSRESSCPILQRRKLRLQGQLARGRSLPTTQWELPFPDAASPGLSNVLEISVLGGRTIPILLGPGSPLGPQPTAVTQCWEPQLPLL